VVVAVAVVVVEVAVVVVMAAVVAVVAVVMAAVVAVVAVVMVAGMVVVAVVEEIDTENMIEEIKEIEEREIDTIKEAGQVMDHMVVLMVVEFSAAMAPVYIVAAIQDMVTNIMS